MTRVFDSEVSEDRFSRLRLISWWDQEKIAKCRLLVVGAGALGNEILKNAALLGFTQVVVVDLDRIEESNLSRAVLYRSEDVGRFKAEAAACAYRSLPPDATVHPVVANVVHGCGLGLFEWSNVIVAGLDNREARLWINRSAWKVNRPWIDGAIEGINGVVRVFLPGVAPCYECTLGEVDWALLREADVVQPAGVRADGGREDSNDPDDLFDYCGRASARGSKADSWAADPGEQGLRF